MGNNLIEFPRDLIYVGSDRKHKTSPTSAVFSSTFGTNGTKTTAGATMGTIESN